MEQIRHIFTAPCHTAVCRKNLLDPRPSHRKNHEYEVTLFFTDCGELIGFTGMDQSIERILMENLLKRIYILKR